MSKISSKLSDAISELNQDGTLAQILQKRTRFNASMTISGEDSLEDIKTEHTNFAYILKRMDKIKHKSKKIFG